MRHLRLTLLSVLSALALLAAVGTGAAQESVVAITGASVVDVEAGRVVPDQTVLVRGSRIAEVGAAGRVRVPAGAAVVDGRGKFVIPGLWDMHVHAFDKPLDGPLFLAFGVTGVRDMASMPPTRAWRDSIRAGTARGPRMLAAGPILDGERPLWAHVPGFTIAVTTPAEAGPAVDSVAARRWDMVKVYTKLAPEPFMAITAEARRRGLPVVGHVPDLVSAGDASDAGLRSFEHDYGLDLACSAREAELRDSLRAAMVAAPTWERYSPIQRRIGGRAAASRDPARCAALFAKLARNGTHWTPTLALQRGFAFMGDSASVAALPLQWVRPSSWWRQNLRALPPEQRAAREQAFRARLAVWGEMHRAGVPILAGTDHGNPNLVAGWSLHEEMRLLNEAGLSPLDALRAATLVPARFLGMADSLGTVRAGRLADLVVLDGNPLEAIANTRRIHAVVANGRLITSADREALLAEAEKAAAGPMVFPSGGAAALPPHEH